MNVTVFPDEARKPRRRVQRHPPNHGRIGRQGEVGPVEARAVALRRASHEVVVAVQPGAGGPVTPVCATCPRSRPCGT